MKNRNIWHQLEEFAVGKGAYIVLALCVGAAGLSGYYLLDRALGPGETVPAPESESLVTIPDPQPETLLPSRPVQKPQPVTLPDPEPAQSAAKPAVPETPAPRPMVFTWPVQGEILRSHSLETLSPDPTMGDWRTHKGVDISAKLGTRVLCMTRGTVAEVWEDEKLGTCIRVDHGEGCSPPTPISPPSPPSPWARVWTPGTFWAPSAPPPWPRAPWHPTCIWRSSGRERPWIPWSCCPTSKKKPPIFPNRWFFAACQRRKSHVIQPSEALTAPAAHQTAPGSFSILRFQLRPCFR